MVWKIGNKPAPSLDQGSLELTEEYIRLRAYKLFEQRGREHGHDIDDWLQAEAEIVGKKQQSMEVPVTPADIEMLG
jgi:HEAT repeat protein